MIPRVIHQIWLGGKPLPREYEGYQRTWTKHNPGWELRPWTENDLPGDLRRPEAAERLRAPAERADILRLEILWREAGSTSTPTSSASARSSRCSTGTNS